jgi:hypothetical protein
MTKAKTNITIEPFILDQAREKGLNVSAIAEDALKTKLNPAHVDLETLTKDEYPFEICAEILPETFRTRLFGMCAIKCKRCQKCNKVFFVNDLNNDFVECLSCSGKTRGVVVYN